MPMTWKELKELVEAELARTGKDDSEIWFVDISFPDKNRVCVSVDKELGIEIS